MIVMRDAFCNVRVLQHSIDMGYTYQTDGIIIWKTMYSHVSIRTLKILSGGSFDNVHIVIYSSRTPKVVICHSIKIEHNNTRMYKSINYNVCITYQYRIHMLELYESH